MRDDGVYGRALYAVFDRAYLELPVTDKVLLKCDVRELDEEEELGALDSARELRRRIGGVEQLEYYVRCLRPKGRQ